MKSLSLLLAGALAVTNALATPTSDVAPLTSRATSNKVLDGSFEDIPQSDDFETDITTGGWTLQNRVTPYHSINDDDATPYGHVYLIFWNQSRKKTTGSASQRLTGLTAASYTLKYAYSLELIEQPICTMTVTLGTQTVDSFKIPVKTPEANGPWMTRTSTVSPTSSEGNLKFKVSCPGSDGFWRIYLDNVSLV